VKFIGAGLGAVGLGAPGAIIGGYAANELIRSTYKTRLDETALLEKELFENTNGCEFADDDAETEWVVECLIRSTETFEWRANAERVAHDASGRAHLPRSAPSDLDHPTPNSSGTASIYNTEETRVFVRDAHVTQNERHAAAAAESANNIREDDARTTEVFSVDSLGNVGGLLGEGLRAFGEGLRGVMRDGGEEATPTGRANPEARGDDENSGSSERASSERESSERASLLRARRKKIKKKKRAFFFARPRTEARGRRRRAAEGRGRWRGEPIRGDAGRCAESRRRAGERGGESAREPPATRGKRAVIRRPRESGRRRRAELEPRG